MGVAAREEYVPMKTGFPVEDVKLRKSQTFPRYTNLKDTGVDLELTLEQEIEYMKCAQDPVYFAKNYYKITSIDKGFILFDPFPYQEELLKAFHGNRFTIDVQCRQSGKCVRGDTKIRVRNKKTRVIEELTIEEFHDRMMSKTLPSKPTDCALKIRKALNG